MKTITLSGLDGSGKSTQVELLKSFLESQGKKVFYFHAVSFSLPNKLLSLFKNKVSSEISNSEKSMTKTGWLGVQLRKFFLVIDIFRFKRLVRSLQSQGYDFIISDRYFYDSVINVDYLSRSSSALCAEKMIPSPDVAVYLNADPQKIMERERKPDQGINYLIEKKDLLDNKYSDWNMIVVDGNMGKEDVHLNIKRLVEKYL